MNPEQKFSTWFESNRARLSGLSVRDLARTAVAEVALSTREMVQIWNGWNYAADCTLDENRSIAELVRET